MRKVIRFMGIRIRLLSLGWIAICAFIAWLISGVLCWVFTYLDPKCLPSIFNIDTSYKNSENVISHLQPIPVYSFVDDGVNDHGFVKTLGDLKLRDEGYKKHGFNTLASRNIGQFREIPDTRHPLCKDIVYPLDLPAVSVIICFYNEDFNTLIRSVYSILLRTPSHILHELLLIDDFSDIPTLHDDVQRLMNSNEMFKKVSVHKTQRREGLIRARIFGATLATGDVLVFLDSHVEVNVKWLESLLKVIAINRTVVATPVIDIINPDTFEYGSSPLVRGGFNWGLSFNWENLPIGVLQRDEDFVKPIRSPTMAGGLFAIDRKYFNELGQYDPHMDLWGGENLELSFKVWMCGGSLQIVPCSRIGHVFRKHRPYASPDGTDTMLKNSLRVAHVWLDDYKKYFLAQRPDAKNIDYGDVSDRIELRKNLRCNSFSWYLKNVYPELVLPDDDKEKLSKKLDSVVKPVYQKWDARKRNYTDYFMIKLSNSSLCVASEKGVREKGSALILQSCLRSKDQIWYQTDRNELILGKILCLDTNGNRYKPRISKCHELGGSQEWKFNKQQNDAPIYNIASGTCLGANDSAPKSYLIMSLCSSDRNIKWNLVSV